MKKVIETIKNICKIEDLRNRILITLLFVLIYRFGSFIVLPGVNPGEFDALDKQVEGGLMSLLNMFSGGAFSNASIFALGIMPYISASIVIQLLSIAVPSFQKMQKEGESGRRKITQYTRYLTVLILLVQGPAYLKNLTVQMPGVPSDFWFYLSSTIILCAGSMFVMWLGERITDKGIGNGISFIILIGIIARFPEAVAQEFVEQVENKGGGLVMFILEMALFIVVIGGAIMLVQGVRRIPVQYAKQLAGSKQQVGGVRQYIPLKVNAAGVMPIIFAQALMFIPLAVIPMVTEPDPDAFYLDTWSFGYNLIFAVLIIAFTYFYTAITIQPNQMADDMKRNGGFIPGVKPGSETAEYIDTVLSRITLPGSFFLVLIAVMPAIVKGNIVQADQFALFFGGTSLLILVGVVLDTLQQVESHLMMHHYDGLMESGRIQGRNPGMSAY
ncbi:MAG: preprotein translocase subunit SecY [Paludibacteraceae bacterium]|jgi:preprotein translocase subunit SecY|nr:preprotein translocase subunit SecY [Paludibacteraceae bacterium]MBO5988542.1 preprotein translocase subunit SecY [Paludibacteraceae bacterium]